MSYIKYGNFQFSAVSGYPVPQVSISREYDRDGAGKQIGEKLIIGLEGQIYYSSGQRGFQLLLQAESGLRQNFVDGKNFELGCTGVGGGTTPLVTGIAKILRYSADKTNDRWLNTIGYTIDLEINIAVTGSGIFYVSSVQDEWSMETLEDASYVNSPIASLTPNLQFNNGTGYPHYRVTRVLGAVGKYIPSGKSSIENAKDWVKYQIASGISLTGMLSGLQLYNFIRSTSVNDKDGSYRITDTWLATPSGAVSGFAESFSIDTSYDNSFQKTITIQGTVKGLEPFNTGLIYNSTNIGTSASGSLMVNPGRIASESKFKNAISGYSGIKNVMFDRARSFIDNPNDASGIMKRFFGRSESPLNPVPYGITEGFNPTEGTVTYSWTYNNRPLNLISGSISETLSVNDSFPTQQIAEIFILGRRLGPILQDLGTWTTSNRDVTFEVVMPKPSSLSGLKFPRTAYQAITGIVESLNPSYIFGGGGSCKSFVKANTENWFISEGRFVKQKTWQWTRCDGQQVTPLSLY
jgi:hypothetical protein